MNFAEAMTEGRLQALLQSPCGRWNFELKQSFLIWNFFRHLPLLLVPHTAFGKPLGVLALLDPRTSAVPFYESGLTDTRQWHVFVSAVRRREPNVARYQHRRC